MPALSQTERLGWLQLIRTETIEPVSFTRLVERYGSPARAIEALPQLAAKAGRRAALKPASCADAEGELQNTKRAGARMIARREHDYPKPLAAIADAPPVIYVRGHASLFDRAGVGRKMARMLAEGLGQAGVVVVSGLARGIDGAAHEAALNTGRIAVVAGGVDVIYPPKHGELAAAIAERGLVLSRSSRRAPSRQRVTFRGAIA